MNSQTNTTQASYKYSNEIHDIREILQRKWQCVITHNCLEENQCADYLAKMETNSMERFCAASKTSIGLNSFLLVDATVMSFFKV